MNHLKTILAVNIAKTIFFNFKIFPIKIAYKLPVLIGYHTKFISLAGQVKIESEIKLGMIRFGFSNVGIVDKKYTRTLIELNGTLIFKGTANIGNGSKISVGEKGYLTIGNNFFISASTTIICFESITLGDNVAISWDVIIMDTDFHETANTVTNEINQLTKPIKPGNNTWVGMRAILLKGTSVPANTIIGAGSLLNRIYTIQENTILAGNPATLKSSHRRKV